MRNRKTISIIVGLLLAIGYWALENVDLGAIGKGGKRTESSATSVGDYERLAGCTLIDGRNSDGDSFHVRHGDKEYEFRLYFVDAPESKYKTYGGGENNGQRIREQGEYFGGLNRERTTEVGQESKKFTLNSLRGRPFVVYTSGEEVYQGPRLYCLVKLEDSAGKERWLHEMLVEQGLVRIHTKGSTLPDGTPWHKERDRLRAIERKIKAAGLGAWR